MLSLFKKLFKKQYKKSSEELAANQFIYSGNDLIASSSITLNEQVFGNVYCLGDLIVDIDSDVCGNVTAKKCIIKGRVTGEILAAEYINIKSTAIIEGRIRSASVDVEIGAVINGYIMIEKNLDSSELIKKVSDSRFNTVSVQKAEPKEAQIIAVKKQEEPQFAPPVVPEEKVILREKKITNSEEKKPDLFDYDSNHWW